MRSAVIRMERAGQSIALAQADLTLGGAQLFAEIARTRSTAVVYSDPPWNPGNEKYWRRMAGVDVPRDYTDLLTAWVRCVVAAEPEHVFVEQSVIDSHRGMLMAAISREPRWRWPLLATWTVQYGSPKRPNALMHFGPSPISTDPSGMFGVNMTRTVFRGLPFQSRAWVADPCMGLGTTARVAAEFGFSVYGTELNPKRLGVTVERLRKAGFVTSAEAA